MLSFLSNHNLLNSAPYLLCICLVTYIFLVSIICMLLTGSGYLTLLSSSRGKYSETRIHLHSRVFELPHDWTTFCIGLQYDMIVDSSDNVNFRHYLNVSFFMFGVRRNCTNLAKLSFGIKTCRNCTLECTVESDGTGGPFKVSYIQF